MRPVMMRDFDITYRGPASSKMMKDLFSQIKADILTAMRSTAAADTRLRDLAIAVNYETQALAARTEELDTTLTAALAAYNDSVTDKLAVVSMHKPGAVIAGTANHNAVYGQLTLPFSSSVSRISTIRDTDGFLQPTPNIVAEIDDGAGFVLQDRTSPAYKALDHNHGTFWIAEYGSGSRSVSFKVSYPTPTSPMVNVITVNPFPEDYVTVTNILYNRLGTFQQIPQFTSTSRRAIYHFQGVEVSGQITVNLWNVATGLASINDATVYPVGAQIIDVGFADFSSDAYAVIEIPLGGDTATSISSVALDAVLNTTGGQALMDYLRVQIFDNEAADWEAPGAPVYDSNVSTYPYTTDLPLIAFSSVGTLYAKVTFTKVANTTPVVRALKLTYR